MEAEAVGNVPLRLVFSNHKSAGKRKKSSDRKGDGKAPPTRHNLLDSHLPIIRNHPWEKKSCTVSLNTRVVIKRVFI